MRLLLTVLFAGAFAASPVLAQAPPARPAAPRAPEYDPAAEVTVQGTIEDFHESKMRGDHPGLHLVVRTETESVEVHACPVRFMRELEFELQKGDAVKVVGSRPGGAGVLVARELTKGQVSLILRDKKGAPVWTAR